MKSFKMLQIRSFRVLCNVLKKSTSENVRTFSVSACGNLKMNAWQVHSYGEDLILSNVRIPILTNVNDVLIKIEAASINPIDLLMKDGYAQTVLKVLSKCEMELPLTLGRDFCGTIVSKGLSTSEKFQIGDKVYGFIPLIKQGCFAEYALADESHICHKPEHLSPTESASLVYTTMTAWSALFKTGRLKFKECENKKVLILGASGGVGISAIQLLKSQGTYVVGTCATDAVPLVMSLNADKVFDYTQPDYLRKIAQEKFNVVLDCAQFGIQNVPDYWKFEEFITLNSPLMTNTDQLGLVQGLIKSGATILAENIFRMKDGKTVKWGFFVPSGEMFKSINQLIENKQINPVLHSEFRFECLPEAFKEVERGHLRGKVVVNYI